MSINSIIAELEKTKCRLNDAIRVNNSSIDKMQMFIGDTTREIQSIKEQNSHLLFATRLPKHELAELWGVIERTATQQNSMLHEIAVLQQKIEKQSETSWFPYVVAALAALTAVCTII